VSGKWHGGKGSGRRKGADDKKFADNWDTIFGNKNKDKPDKEKPPKETK
jgi:hypothetical protein